MSEEEKLRLASERIDYNPETGVFAWKSHVKIQRRMKSEVGATSTQGYRKVSLKIDGKFLYIRLHRLAWFIHTKSVPQVIDHINGIKTDNRICNLRDVSLSINAKNAKLSKRNTSGVIGVSRYENKWRGLVNSNKKQYVVGTFEKIEDAEEAIKKFRALHGFTERHGTT